MNLSELTERDVDTGLPILRVWPDWASSGLWNPPSLTGLYVGIMIDAEDLDLPEDVAEALTNWRRRWGTWNSQVERPPEFWTTFDAEKLRLTLALSDHLGDRVFVECEIGGRAVVCLNGAPTLVLKMDEYPATNASGTHRVKAKSLRADR